MLIAVSEQNMVKEDVEREEDEMENADAFFRYLRKKKGLQVPEQGNDSEEVKVEDIDYE